MWSSRLETVMQISFVFACISGINGGYQWNAALAVYGMLIAPAGSRNQLAALVAFIVATTIVDIAAMALDDQEHSLIEELINPGTAKPSADIVVYDPTTRVIVGVGACAINVMIKVVGAGFGFMAFQGATDSGGVPGAMADGDYNAAPGTNNAF